MPAEPPGNYRVATPGPVRDIVLAWSNGRIGLRFRGQAVAALRIIYQGLTSSPLEWGDPLYRLPNLGMLVHHRIIFPIYVAYGVNVEHRLVVVRAIQPIIDAHPHWDLF